MSTAKKIFLATESPQIASIITSKLERDGLKVAWKSNGAESLRAIFAEPPDLMILDSVLPDVSGYELLGKIRGNPVTEAHPVFILLDTLQEYSEMDFIQQGADMVFIKPFRPTNLSKKIRKTLARLELADKGAES